MSQQPPRLPSLGGGGGAGDLSRASSTSNVASPTRHGGSNSGLMMGQRAGSEDGGVGGMSTVGRAGSRDMSSPVVSSSAAAAKGGSEWSDGSSAVARVSKSASPAVADQLEDPYDIKSRFIRGHMQSWRNAISELRGSGKASCWSWWIVPTAPWIVDGRERGSMTNRQYCLRDARSGPKSQVGYEACLAYLLFPEMGNINLRQNYVDLCEALAEKLEKGWTLLKIVGFLDEPKARSSFKLFEKTTRGRMEPELREVHTAVRKVMLLSKTEPDQ